MSGDDDVADPRAADHDLHQRLVDGRAGRPRLRGWSHVVASVGVVVAAPWLWLAAGDALARWAVVVFVIGVLAMLVTSAAYHVGPWSPAMVVAMQRADHSTIFLAIAGTYTPFLVVGLDGRFRLWMMVGVWGGALAGIVVNQVAHHAPPWVRMMPYLVLGWTSVVLLPALWRLSPTILVLVVAGGLAYTLGAIAYAIRRPNPWPGWFGHHEVFHFLTVVAITLHWVAVCLTVA